MQVAQVAAVVFLVGIAVATAFPFRYPGILLCATASPAPEVKKSLDESTTLCKPSCLYRAANGVAFVACGHHSVLNITLNSTASTSTLYCSAYNEASLRHAALTAKDTASIITFLQRKPSDLVNYVALWASRQAPPTSLDEFTDLIYVFKEHGLVTVQGRYGSGDSPSDYSVSLHTHADPSPQELWVRLDALYTEVSSE